MQAKRDPEAIARDIITRNQKFYWSWHNLPTGGKTKVVAKRRLSSSASGRFSEENLLDVLRSYFPANALCTGIVYKDDLYTGQVDIIVLKHSSKPPLIQVGSFVLVDANDVTMAVEVKNDANKGIPGIKQDIGQVSAMKPVLFPAVPWILWIGMRGGPDRAHKAIECCKSAEINGAIVALFREYQRGDSELVVIPDPYCLEPKHIAVELNPETSFGRFLHEVELLAEKY